MRNENIQVFVPKFRVDETLDEIRECLERGWTGLGYKTVELEDAWKQYTGHANAHFLSSATAALHLAVAVYKSALKWDDGDEIISSAMTFVSTNHAVLYERMKVVFADVDQYGCLDPVDVEKKITPRTRAVVFVGLGGNTGQLASVRKLCDERGLILILDGAHMAGTRLHGKFPGVDLADVSCYSFQAVKNMPTADSGMVCFADSTLDAAARKLAWLGISRDTFARSSVKGDYKWYYDVESVGFKYNGNALMAAVGLVALRYLDEDNFYRRQICAWYDAYLDGIVGIDKIEQAEGCEGSRHLYQVLVANRDAVLQSLYELGIFPGVHYRDNTQYQMYAYAHGTLPRTEYMSDHLISLPLHLGLTEVDIQRVSSGLIDAVRKHES